MNSLLIPITVYISNDSRNKCHFLTNPCIGGGPIFWLGGVGPDIGLTWDWGGPGGIRGTLVGWPMGGTENCEGCIAPCGLLYSGKGGGPEGAFLDDSGPGMCGISPCGP